MKSRAPLLYAWLLLGGAAFPACVVAAPEVAFSAVARVSQVDGSRAEIAVRSGSILRSGDEIQLRLVTDRDAYVYVLAHGSSGSLEVLRPFSGDDGDARMRARVEQAWPDSDTFLPLDDQEGQETLFAIASERPLGDLRPLLEQLEIHGADADAVSREVEATFPATTTLRFRHVARDALVGLPAGVPRRSSAAPEAPEAPEARSDPGQDAPDMRALMESLPGDPSSGQGESGVLSASGSLIEKLTRGRDLPVQAPIESAPAARAAPPALPQVERPPAESVPAEKPSLSRRLGRLFRFGRKDPDDEVEEAPVGSDPPDSTPTDSTPTDGESRAPSGGTLAPQARALPVPEEPGAGNVAPARTLALRSSRAGDKEVSEQSLTTSALRERSEGVKTAGDIARSVVLVVTPRSSGAGVVLDRAGRVLTSWHAVAGSTSASVLVPLDGEASLQSRYGARVLRIDRFADLALLSITDPPDLAPAALAAAESVRIGASVRVLTPNWPDGLGRVSGKVVRAQHRSSWTSAGTLHRARLIRAELEADPGMPGVPVFDERDRLVGMAVAAGRKLGAVSVVSMETIHAFLGQEARSPRLARVE